MEIQTNYSLASKNQTQLYVYFVMIKCMMDHQRATYENIQRNKYKTYILHVRFRQFFLYLQYVIYVYGYTFGRKLVVML
jgi:hypothetical protein